MYNTAIPLLKITAITSQMRLTIQSLPLLRQLPHPTNLRAIDALHHQPSALLPQLLRHSIDIDAEKVAQKVADLGVLVVTLQRAGSLGVRRVNIDVRGAVAVGRPAGLRAARDHVCVLVEGGCGVFEQRGNFGVGVVVDAEAGGEGGADEICG